MTTRPIAGGSRVAVLDRVSAAQFAADVVSTPDKLRSLAADASHLLRTREATASPAFFLASIDAQSWSPRVVVVKCEGEIRGIVYTKERKVAGLPTGLIYVDASLDSMILADGDDTALVFKSALARLLKDRRTLGLRLMVPGDERFAGVLEELRSENNLDLHRSEIQHHCVLDLTDRYESFLDRLGSTTRRNFRYYRRRFEATEGTYVPEMSPDDFRSAAFHLLQKGVVGANRVGLERAVRMISAAERRMMAGLRDPEGNWLAIVGGWYEGDQAWIFCQMNNDTDYPNSSLCTVLRGYLFEWLIERSRTKVLFWAGVGGPLLRHCDQIPTTAVYLDRRMPVWRWLRNLCAASVKYLPRALGSEVSWVSPVRSPSKSRC